MHSKEYLYMSSHHNNRNSCNCIPISELDHYPPHSISLWTSYSIPPILTILLNPVMIMPLPFLYLTATPLTQFCPFAKFETVYKWQDIPQNFLHLAFSTQLLFLKLITASSRSCRSMTSAQTLLLCKMPQINTHFLSVYT